MKENKETTEQELDQVAGGTAFINLGDIKVSFTRSCLGLVHPEFKVGRVGSDPKPHPKVVKDRYGIINPDIM